MSEERKILVPYNEYLELQREADKITNEANGKLRRYSKCVLRIYTEKSGMYSQSTDMSYYTTDAEVEAELKRLTANRNELLKNTEELESLKGKLATVKVTIKEYNDTSRLRLTERVIKMNEILAILNS